VETVRHALRSTSDNKQRVAATFGAYFEYVGGEGQAYRLVFESDLSNEPAVRDRLDRGQRECAEMVSQVVKEDAGLDEDEAHLLSVGMVGMAQVTAQVLAQRPAITSRGKRPSSSWPGWPGAASAAGRGTSIEGPAMEVRIGEVRYSIRGA
jgi:hypothetical protein